MHYPTPRITQPGRWKKYLWSLVIILLILLLTVYIISREYYQNGGLNALQVIPLQTKLKRAQEKIEALEAERLSLQQNLAEFERRNHLNQKATKQVQASLQQRQLACLKMEEELDFLRHMVSVNKPNNGLKIQKMSLEPTGKAREFIYRFTISQGLNKPGNTSGWIYLFVKGESGGEVLLLNLQQITEEKIEKIKMKFQHFQDVEGTIRLPKGFMPQKLTVEIKPGNKKLSSLKETLDWIVTE